MKFDSNFFIGLAFLVFIIFSVFYYGGGKNMNHHFSLDGFTTSVGGGDDDDTNQFIQNNITTSNNVPLTPAATDAETSHPEINHHDVTGGGGGGGLIDSQSILPNGNAGMEIMLLSPENQIGRMSPPSKISFLSGGDIRSVPCLDKMSQSSIPWGYSSILPTDIQQVHLEIGTPFSCSS